MKQLVHKGLLRTLIITCLANTNSIVVVKVSEQFHYSLERYLQGNLTVSELN